MRAGRRGAVSKETFGPAKYKADLEQTRGGSLFQGLTDSASVSLADCLCFATEVWRLGGVARWLGAESGAGPSQHLSGRLLVFRLAGVADMMH